MNWRSKLGVAVLGVVVVGCSEDPQYVGPPAGMSFSLEFDSANMTPAAPVTVVMPFRIETADEATERGELAALLAVDVPFVKLEDVDISIEWSVKNLLDCDAQAEFTVNGGNEWFRYDPTVFVIDPDDDEEPPPLIGNMAPTDIAGNKTVTGVFREDQVREAAIDLELITRAHYNPFRALLEVNKNLDTMEIYTEVDLSVEDPPPQTGTGMFIAREAWAQMTQFELSFSGSDNDPDMGCDGVHLVFEWDFRIRDHRGILHERGLDAAAGELTAFMPADYAPPGAVTP